MNVLASVIFSGMSGSAVADVGGLGQVEIKAMRDSGYDEGFTIGVTAASGTIGPIIPPSIPMVVIAPGRCLWLVSCPAYLWLLCCALCAGIWLSRPTAPPVNGLRCMSGCTPLRNPFWLY